MLNLPGAKLNLSAPISAIFGSKRGCLHVESAFLAVGEVACTSSLPFWQWERRPARRVGDRLL